MKNPSEKLRNELSEKSLFLSGINSSENAKVAKSFAEKVLKFNSINKSRFSDLINSPLKYVRKGPTHPFHWHYLLSGIGLDPFIILDLDYLEQEIMKIDQLHGINLAEIQFRLDKDPSPLFKDELTKTYSKIKDYVSIKELKDFYSINPSQFNDMRANSFFGNCIEVYKVFFLLGIEPNKILKTKTRSRV